MKNWILGALLTLGCFMSSMAWGQCIGVDAGGGNCVPPPGVQGSPLGGGNSAPPAVWSDRYGAIARDDTSGKSGMASNQLTQAQANEAALDMCRKKGALNCKIAVPYFNGCAAIANGETVTGSGYANDNTQKGAEKRAINFCMEATHGQPCKIFYSACSFAVRVQ